MKHSVEFIGMQPGDVKKTFADIKHSQEKLNYTPTTKIAEGQNLYTLVNWNLY